MSDQEPFEENEGSDKLELRKLVTIKVFTNLAEALFAKGSLESAGIECFLIDENMVRLDWFIVNVIGGIKLQVSTGDAESALRILNQPYLVSPETEE